MSSIPTGYLGEFGSLYEAQSYLGDLARSLKEKPETAHLAAELYQALEAVNGVEDKLRVVAAANPREEPGPIPGWPGFAMGYGIVEER